MFANKQNCSNICKADWNTMRLTLSYVHDAETKRQSPLEADGIRLFNLPPWKKLMEVEKAMEFPRASPMKQEGTNLVLGGAVDDVEGLVRLFRTKLQQSATEMKPIVSFRSKATPDAGKRWIVACHIDGTGRPWPIVKTTLHFLNASGVRFGRRGAVATSILNMPGAFLMSFAF